MALSRFLHRGSGRRQRHAPAVQSRLRYCIALAVELWSSTWCARANRSKRARLSRLWGIRPSKSRRSSNRWRVHRVAGAATRHRPRHARRAARSCEGAKYAIVLPGDAPLVRTETLAALARTTRGESGGHDPFSAVLANPSGYGRILRRQDESVVGHRGEIRSSPTSSAPSTRSIPAFTRLLSQKLWPCLARLRPDNKHRELYLTDAIALLAGAGHKPCSRKCAPTPMKCSDATRAPTWPKWIWSFRSRKRASADGLRRDHPVARDDSSVDPDVLRRRGHGASSPDVQLLGHTAYRRELHDSRGKHHHRFARSRTASW